jgi:hypothetical protein
MGDNSIEVVVWKPEGKALVGSLGTVALTLKCTLGEIYERNGFI